MVFQPEELDEYRLSAPAVARNREPIFKVLLDFLPKSGTVLEIASGTGEHATFLATKMPHLGWLPSDVEGDHLTSIEGWRQKAGGKNLLSPIKLDVIDSCWPVENYAPDPPIKAVLAINLLHIAPWEVAEGLFEGAARVLNWGGVLILYGPYRVDGEHTAPSNLAFDQVLINKNPKWGVRDLDSVKLLARSCGFAAPDVIDMPANNKMLIFRLS